MAPVYKYISTTLGDFEFQGTFDDFCALFNEIGDDIPDFDGEINEDHSSHGIFYKDEKIAERITGLRWEEIVGMDCGVFLSEWKVIAIVEKGRTTFYPALINENERLWSSFRFLEEYMANRVERERMIIRVLIEGNLEAAERAIREMTGYECCATERYTLDIYIPI